MKFKALLSIVLVAGMAVVYTACKKSDSSPAGPALTESQVTSQVVLDLTQSLFGGYGGINFNDGLNGPTGFGTKHLKGPLLHDLSNPFCGLVIDTTLNETVNAGADSSLAVSGHIHFGFSCTNDVVTGFNTNDNLTIAISTPRLSIMAKILENLTLSTVNPADDNSPLLLKGTLNSSGTYKYKTGNKSGTRSFNYVLNSLIIDPNNDDGDIRSGSVNFITKGTGSNGSWSFTGTITFLGNHKAKVTINGKTYNVDIRTGVVV